MSRPQVGFLGVGWIGRHRMEAMIGTGAIDAAAICEPSPEMAAAALAVAPAATIVTSFEQMLAMQLDGIVIATPSALHAGQAIAALQSGAAVFCQKPLGRNAAETGAVVQAAQLADRLLAVDFSYRFTAGIVAIRDLIERGELGTIHAIDLTFHNAYGPDKPWFYDKLQSGGGCVMDLGVHLVDLALWLLDFPGVKLVSSHLTAQGQLVGEGAVEDFAVATLTLHGGAVVRLACSWRQHCGGDALIQAQVFGTHGGAALRNVAGSFYDFAAEHFVGTTRKTLTTPPDAWGGRAAAVWAQQLAIRPRYNPSSGTLSAVALVIDRIYSGC